MPRSTTPDSSPKRSTIQDVANAAGVSIATVSRVVNGEGQVRSATRERVLAVIDTLRYRPTLSARQLSGARSKWIALVYQNPGIGFMHLVQSGAVDRCRNDGYMLSVHACQFTGAGLDRELLGIVDQLEPSGLILPPPMSVSPQVIETLGKRGIPFVRLCPLEDHHLSPRVWFDDRSAMQAMTRHVLDLGHREIALITGLPASAPDPRRLGYLDAVREAHLSSAERNIAYGAYAFEGALTAAQVLLQRKRRPTAILAASDDMAAATLHTAHAMGLRVPEDLSVTGFDDSYVSTVVSPGLTTVHAPLHEMGAAAADLLIKGPPDMDAGLVINRPWRLVQRGSTAAPANKA
jgi:LacI family transcriptional regulator